MGDFLRGAPPAGENLSTFSRVKRKRNLPIGRIDEQMSQAQNITKFGTFESIT